MEINQTELKKLMHLYFDTTAGLLPWMKNEAWTALSDRILDLILEILDKKEYREACRQIIDTTAVLTTLTDCSLLKVRDKTMPREMPVYFDMKADLLKHHKIDEVVDFDMDVLLIDNHQGVIAGEGRALRLGACLSWLELDSALAPDAALRYWQVLAYTGDYFAMEALAYAYDKRQDEENKTLWELVRQICLEADRLFTLTVPGKFLQPENMEAANIAQLILAVRDICANDEKERLPMPMLQYAIDSKEEIGVKLQNLRLAPENHYELLMRQSRRSDGKRIGF